MPGVLPPLDDEQSLEVTAVHSVAGLLDDGMPLITRPPFVDPHHSASQAAIIGGGSAHIRPGSVSLAHCGVLFLDEAPEFKPTVLDALAAADGGGVGVVGAGVGGGAVSGAVPVDLGGESVSVCGGEGRGLHVCGARCGGGIWVGCRVR